jgi:hypothetical protein
MQAHKGKSAASGRLAELAAEMQDLAASAEHQRRARLWADVMRLRGARPVVNFYVYASVWEAELTDAATFRCPEGLARDLEKQMLFKIWRAKTIPDDTPLDPSVTVFPERPRRSRPFPWGVEMPVERAATPGSYKEVPVLWSEADLERLSAPHYEEDTGGTRERAEQAGELVNDQAPVHVRTDELHWGPFEYAVRLRGIENLLADVCEAPEFVHRLMATLTDGMVAYQKEREAAGAVSAQADSIGHVHWRQPPRGKENRLSGCGAYIHAQSAASLSPAMYAEFVHPHNCRLAELVGWTYYHGCEDLSQKCRIIKSLPNLRLFHVSPWTPIEPVIAELGPGVVYEVHSHPTTVIYGEDRAGIRRELVDLHSKAAGAPHVLALADVETFHGRFERTVYWAETAQELAASARGSGP